jgi:hypothetical protein
MPIRSLSTEIYIFENSNEVKYQIAHLQSQSKDIGCFANIKVGMVEKLFSMYDYY